VKKKIKEYEATLTELEDRFCTPKFTELRENQEKKEGKIRPTQYLEKTLPKLNPERSLGVVSGIHVCREGEYSCPVKSMLIVVSLTEIDIENPLISSFNNVSSEEKVREVLQSDEKLSSSIQISQTTSKDGINIVEFTPVSASSETTRPLLWVQFVDDEKLEFDYQLTNPVLMSYAHFMLIDCLDKTRPEEVAHFGGANIDIQAVVLEGKLVNLVEETEPRTGPSSTLS